MRSIFDVRVIANVAVQLPILLLFLTSVRVLMAQKLEKSLRVYHGDSVTFEEVPFVMVIVKSSYLSNIERLQRDEQKLVHERPCTCSLIAPAWIISASHCFERENLKLHVIYGDLTQPIETTKQRSKIIEVFMHPNYEAGGTNGLSYLRNDISLANIDPIYNVPPAKISATYYGSLYGYPVKYYGGGGTFSLKDSNLKRFKKIKQIIKADAKRLIQVGQAVIVKCSSENMFKYYVPKICLASLSNRREQTAVLGDAGGPVMFKNKIVGVCSTGALTTSDNNYIRGDDEKDGIGIQVYTPVSPYLDWISDIVRNISTVQ